MRGKLFLTPSIFPFFLPGKDKIISKADRHHLHGYVNDFCEPGNYCRLSFTWPCK